MPFAMDIDEDVEIDMSDSQFLLSLKPASKEEEVEEKIQRIAEGKAREGIDISVYDALDYIGSITQMGKTYYQARYCSVSIALLKFIHTPYLDIPYLNIPFS
jgi:hypothetical protein